MHNQQTVKYIKSYYFLLNLPQLGEEHRVFFGSSLSGKWNKWNCTLVEKGIGNGFRTSDFVMHFCRKLEAHQMNTYARFENNKLL